MNVPTRDELKSRWWAEQPKEARDMMRRNPGIGVALFELRGMIEFAINVKPDGKATVVSYEHLAG